jgi:hypothetical protein
MAINEADNSSNDDVGMRPEDVQLEAHLAHETVHFADVSLEADRAEADPTRIKFYRQLLDSFERSAGTITFRYDTPKLSMAVTQRPRSRLLSYLGFSGLCSLHTHVRAPISPLDRDLLDRISNLATRAETNLRSSDRAQLIVELTTVQSVVLAQLTRSAELPDWLRNQALEKLENLDQAYSVREKRGVNLAYFLAMLGGLGPAVLFGAIAGWFFALADVPSFSYSTFVATFALGAFGAVVSVMVRKSNDRFDQPTELGRGWIRVLAAVRPFLGGVFGTLSYFALESHLMGLTVNQQGGTRFFAYCVIAFLAGFSERIAQDVLVFTARGTRTDVGGRSISETFGRQSPDEQLTLREPPSPPPD